MSGPGPASAPRPDAADPGDERARTESSFAYAGLFFVIFSLTQAGLIVYCRRGLFVPGRLLLLGGCLFAACAWSPFLPPERFRLGRAYLGPLLSLAVLLSALAAFALGGLAPALVYLYAALAALGAWRGLSRLRRMPPLHYVFLLLAPVFAVYVFQYFNSWNYAGVYAPEQALLGHLRKDTYYHAAVAQMIQNFGTVSTGMDGLTRLHYHIGSHVWMAGLGRCAGSMPLLTYPVIHLTVLVPALMLAVSFAVICAGPGSRGNLAAPVWTMVLLLGADGLGRPSHYVSESYTAGLAALLLCWPLLTDLMRRPRPGKTDALRLALALAAVFLLHCLKVSVGVLWSGALGWVLLRRYGLGIKGLGLAAAAGLIGLASFRTFYDPGFDTDLEPFRFLARAPGLLLLTNLIAPALYLGAVLTSPQISRGSGLRRAAAERTVVGAEVIALMTLASALPAVLLRLPIASAWFFLNIPQWPAWTMFAGQARWPGPDHPGRRWIARAAAAAVLAAAAGWMTGQLSSAFATGYLGRGLKYLSSIDTHAHPTNSPTRPYGVELDQLIGAAPGHRAYALIMEAALGRGPGFAVSAPASNRAFWTIVNNCQAQPMFVPALTGKPMLYGLLPADMECDLRYYGYPDYGDDAHARDPDRETLCRHARDKGFDTVFVLNDLDHPERNETLDCKGAGQDPH